MAYNILTLPREMRDLIYEYLHRDLELKRVIVCNSMTSVEVEVVVKQAPLMSVHLVHSRMHEEYADFRRHKRYAVSFRFSSMERRPQPSDRHLIPSLNPVLTRLHHAIVLVDYEFFKSIPPFLLHPMIGSIFGHSNNLITFQIAIRISELSVNEAVLGVPKDTLRNNGFQNLQQGPGWLSIASAPLDCVQHCHVVTVDNSAVVRGRGKSYQLHTTVLESSARSSAEKRYWSPEALLTCWEPRSYPNEIDPMFSGEAIITSNQLPCTPAVWLEIRDGMFLEGTPSNDA